MILLPLYNRAEHIVGWAHIDDCDGDQAQHHWRLHAQGYAYRYVKVNNRYVAQYLHREILGLARGDRRQGDHIDRDRLNNRRGNLRAATQAQNGQNVPSQRGTSRFRGVSWDRSRQKWLAHAKLNYRRHHLGRYDSEVEAAAVASAWRREHMPYSVEEIL